MKEHEMVCIKCGKIKSKYKGANGYCQKCYRGMLEEYSYYDYAVPKEKLRGTVLKVCEMLIEEGVERQEIHSVMKLHKVYVNQIINKYTVRVNSEGERRPF